MVKSISLIFHLKASFNFSKCKWGAIHPLTFLLFFISFSSSAIPSNSIENLAKVYQIEQDEKGFIWLIGSLGLTRFDGNNAYTFSNSSPEWPIPFTWIHTITRHNERFIVSTESSQVWFFDPNDASTEKIELNIDISSIYHAVIFENNLYIYGDKKIYVHSFVTQQTKLLAENKDVNNFLISQNTLYISTTNKGLFKLRDQEFIQIIEENISAAIRVENGIIAASENKLHFIDIVGSHHSIEITESIHGLTKEHGKNNVFTVSDKGIVKRYNATSLAELNHHYKNARRARVSALLHDSSGVLWVATSLGIERLSESNIVNHPLVFNVDHNSNELTFYQNEIIIGSYGQGLKKLKEENLFINDKSNLNFSKQGLKITDILTIDDAIYITSFDGLWRFLPTENSLERLPLPIKKNSLIKLRYHDGILFIGSDYEGLLLYDIKRNILIEQIKNNLSSTEVIDIMPLDDGNIWLATANGVDIYNRFSKSLQNIKINVKNKPISIAFQNDKLFVATLGDGIFIFNRNAELLSKIAPNIEFFYSEVIENEIWISATAGLYRINPLTHQFSIVPGTEQYSFSGEPHQLNDKVYINHLGGILEIPLTEQSDFDAKVYISKTLISGEGFLLNKSVNVQSSNDVITLELASLDYRPGKPKQYKYKINNGTWNLVNGYQLTLTGLASGTYNIEIMATNSLGQWSTHRAFTDISVAYPWFWTPQIRVLYLITALCIIALLLWLLYLRAKSISHIHQLLEDDIHSRGKSALTVTRNLTHVIGLLENHPDATPAKELLHQCIKELKTPSNSKEPDNLYGKTLSIALPYFTNYLHKKYHINLTLQIDLDTDSLDYELQSSIYRIIYQAVTSALLNGSGRNFAVNLKKFNDKLWLTISDDEGSFVNFNSVINFNMAMYYIRQIATKYSASVNTFEQKTSGSQLTISFPLQQFN